MQGDDAMCAAADMELLVWSCDAEAQRLSDGDSIGGRGLTQLSGASSPAAAVAVSGGFGDFVSGEGDGLGWIDGGWAEKYRFLSAP